MSSSLITRTMKELESFILKAGKKSVASSILRNTLVNIDSSTRKNLVKEGSLNVLYNKAPSVHMKTERRQGQNVLVPCGIRNGEAYALRWFIKSAKKRGKRNLSNMLASELMSVENAATTSVYQQGYKNRMYLTVKQSKQK